MDVSEGWSAASDRWRAVGVRRDDEHARVEAGVRLLRVEELVGELFSKPPTSLSPEGLAGYRAALRDVLVATPRFEFCHDAETGQVSPGLSGVARPEVMAMEPWEWEFVTAQG